MPLEMPLEIILFVCESHFNEILKSSRKINLQRPMIDAKAIQYYCDISGCYVEPYGVLKLEI